MSYSNIKRVLSAALLLAFTAPSVSTLSACADITDASFNRGSMLLTGDVRLTNNNDQITLSLRDSDVKQVLRMFADKAGMNIVFHDSVNGKVTLDLVKTPINEAFSLVLQIAGLSYYKQGNTMIVMSKSSPDNATFSKQEMYTFPVNYVSAGKIADFLNKNVFGMKRPGFSGVDAATVNSATTPAEMANMICNVLLPSRGIGGESDAADASSVGEDESSEDPYAGETGGAAGIMTGAAADAGGGAEGGGEGGGETGMKLGEGILACSVSAGSTSSSVSPFNVQNLSIAYFPQRNNLRHFWNCQLLN